MKKIYLLALSVLLFAVTVFGQNVIMSNATKTGNCSGTYYDPGGNSNYPDRSNYTQTFYPSAGNKMSFNFTTFRTETNSDYLYVYDGNSTAAPLIGTYTGNLGATIGTILSTANDGSLTFRFTSDNNTNYYGWTATMSCIPMAMPYKDSWISMNTGSSTWCAGETRTVSVTVKNVGTATWTDASPDINIGVKWNADADYFVRVNAGGLTSGATQTYNLTVTAPATTGNNNLTFDIVEEGISWFGNNGGGTGPGNVVYTSPTITIGTPTVNAGTQNPAICKGGTTTGLSGTVGGSATGGTWDDGGVGGTFSPNATTLNATWTPPAGYSGTATLTLTATSSCGSPTSSKSQVVNLQPTASASGSQTICQNGTATVPPGAATATNGTILWTENGAGSITSGANTLTPTYTAAAGDAGNTVTLTMTVSNSPCTAATATYTVVVKGTPTASAGGSKTVCVSSPATVSGAASTNGTILWTHNGVGTLTNATTLTPTYTPAAGDAGNTVTLTMTVSNSPCTDATASYTINVKAIPTASASGSQTICQNGTATVPPGAATATNGTILWTENGAGSITSGANTLTPTYTAAAGDAGNTVTLTMTVSNSPCTAATATYTVVVKGTPTASAGGSKTVCVSSPATVSGAASTNGTILWTHNGVGTLTNATTLTPTYTPAAGDAGNTVTLTMTVSNSPCTNATASYTINVKAIPTASASGSQTICQNGTATVPPGAATATNGTILWTENGAGSITSGANTLTPTYTAAAGDAGNTVTLTMTVSNSPCTAATATYTVVVKGTPTASAGGSKTVCVSSPATVSGAASTNGTILWTHNGVGTLTNATTLTPTYTPAAGDAGNTVTLMMTVSNSPCTDATASYTINVKAIPTASASGSQTICQNGTATVPPGAATATNGTILWTENGAGSITSGANTLTPTYTAAAGDAGNTVTLTMTVSNSPCTAATATYTVVVKGTPTASAGGSKTVCVSSPATVSGAASTNGTILWTHNGVGTLTNATTLTPTYTPAAGDAGNTVTLTMTVSNSPCTDATASYTINVKAIPTASASGSQTICQNGTATVPPGAATATNGTILWTENGAGSITSGANTLTPTYTAAAGDAGNTVTLTMTVSNSPCAAASASYTVFVDKLPAASAGGSQTICSNGTATVSGATAANGTILWTHNGAGSLSNATTLTPTYTPAAGDGGNTIILTMTVTSNNSCSPAIATAIYSVNVNDAPVITTQPDVSQTACATFPVSFTVAATGTGLTYQWYKNGNPLSDNTNVTGSNAAELDIDQAATTDAGTYTVVVSGLSPCASATSGNAVLTVNQEIVINTQPAPQTVCAGSTAIFTIDATGTGVMYQWRKGTVPLSDGVNISGSNTATLTITNASLGDAATNYNVVLTSPGGACPQANSANVKLVVNPIPVVTATPSSQNICSGSATSIALSGNVSGETYSWTVTQSGASGAVAGSGNSISQILTATGTSDGTVTYHITPVANSCPGTTIDVIVTVHPTPVVTATPSSQVLCSGSSTSIALNGNVSGETYSWTVTQSGASGAVAGSGNSISQTLTATGTADGTVTYHITPIANGCPGIAIDVIVTVHPTPVITATPSSQVLCSGSSTSIALSGNISGQTYSWTVTQSSASGAVAGSGNSISQSLTATGTSDGTVTYHITPLANGCPGTTIDVIVTVHPTPVVTATPSSQVLCSGSSTSIALNGNVSGETYSWTVTQSGASGAVAGSGNSISQTLTATGTADGTVTYHITPIANGCPGIAIDVIVTVHPLVSITPLNQEICNGTSITTIGISGLPTGSITSWARDNPAGITSSLGITGTGSITGTFSNSNTTSAIVTFTVNAQAANGCITTTTATVTVDADLVAPVLSASQILCVGSNPAPLTATSATGGTSAGYTYTWQQSNTGNAPWTTATGNTGTLAYTPPANSSYYRLQVTNSCGTVYSNVVQISTASDFGLTFSTSGTPATLCSGDNFDYQIQSFSIGSLFGGRYIKYIWQSQNSGYYTSAAPNPFGTQNIFIFLYYYTGNANFIVHNPTNVPVTQNLLVTPIIFNSDGTVYCNLTPDITTITINPVPVIGNYTTSICSGSGFNIAPVNGSPTSATIVPANTKYSWSAPVVAGINGLAAGTAQSSVSGTLTNTTNAPINVVYTITPSYSGNCAGNPFTITVTVNPKPVIPAQAATICSGGTFTVAPANGVPTSATMVPSNTSYSWSAPTGTGFMGGVAGSGNFVTGTLTNTTTGPVSAIYTVTPTSGAAGSCPGSNFTITVTVNPTVSAGIVSGTSQLCIGQTATFTSTGTSGGTWSSSNGGVASVIAGTGVVTAIGPGTSNIIYTVNSGCGAPVSALQSITVNPNVSPGIVSGTPTTICIGGTTPYSSNGTPGGTWSSSNTSIATVNAGTGVVTGVSAGNATISYTVTGCNAPAPATLGITVNPDANAGTISGTSPLCIGATATYSSSGDAGGTWSSTNTAVASVDPSTGLVNALSAGNTNITYTVNSGCNTPKSSFKSLTVSPNANAGVISGAATICVGAQVGYSSSGNGGGVWSSDNTSVATVTAGGVVKGISGGSATITYTVNAGCNAPVSVSQVMTVSNPGGVTNPGAISGPVSVCPSSAGNVYSIDPLLNPNAASFVWTVPAGWTIVGINNGSSITVTSGTGGGNITVKAANACGFSSASVLYAGIHNLWTGATSTDWNDATNWSDNQVPDISCATVTIPQVPTNRYPVLSSGAMATINSLDIKTNASVTISGNIMQIGGSISNLGTFDVTNGTLEFNGTSQSISGSILKSRSVKDLIISSGGTGLTVSGTIGDTLNILESLSFGNATANLTTGGNLTLKSGIAGTAGVGVLAAGNTINGDVTVERYIATGPAGNPNHGKSWQFLAVPTFGSQTIKAAWQEGASKTNVPPLGDNTPGSVGNPVAGYGTMITSAVTNATTQPTPGFDAFTAPGPSLKIYDSLSASYYGTANTQVPVFNQRGYFVFVRGDRSVYTSGGAANPTILRTKGTLFTPANPPLTSNVASGLFESVGNPYASAIDMRNIALGGKTQQFFIVWDPRLGGAYNYGAFQTLSYDQVANHFYATPGGGSYGSGPVDYIQSGQAFFVQAFGGSGTVSFTESCKATGSSLFTTPAPVNQVVHTLRTSLYTVNSDGSTGSILDGVLSQFDDAFSNAIDGMDARKMTNTGENLGIKTAGRLLSVERRHTITSQDTIFLNITSERNQPYRFHFDASNLDPTVQGYVVDNFTNTRTPLNMTGATDVDFTVTGVTGSNAANRFMIVFEPLKALQVTFTSIKAYRQDKNINVEWRVENEENMKQYEVEKSTDGSNFTGIAQQKPTANNGGSAVYVADDTNPVTGFNYYRVKSVDINGKTSYTNVVKVLMGTIKQDITIYPNPITDGMIHLQFLNEPAGKYNIRLLNKLGQVILQKQVTRADGNGTELIKWNYNLAHGMYQLEIARPDGSVKDINVMY